MHFIGAFLYNCIKQGSDKKYIILLNVLLVANVALGIAMEIPARTNSFVRAGFSDFYRRRLERKARPFSFSRKGNAQMNSNNIINLKSKREFGNVEVII